MCVGDTVSEYDTRESATRGHRPADAGRSTVTDPLADADVRRVLDADGHVLPDAAVPDLSDETLVDIYRDMRVTRRFDERAVSLQRQGRIGTYAPSAGQEASTVASTHALAARDYVSYQYREHGAVVVRDLLDDYLPYWMGHESGNAAMVEGNVVPLNIGVGSHIPHAVGLAWAASLRGDETVVACHFGDGATSEGDFHEGLNFAGVFDTPSVFCCHNNGWAISIPEGEQTASDTFAEKAVAYGFDGVRVDGMDPLASYAATREAVDRARDPAGEEPRPSLVEFVEYRFGAHTTADDPGVYRDEDAVDRWRALDPIPRYETFLRETGRIDDEGVQAVADEADEVVAAAVDAASTLDGDPAEMFADAYANLPAEVRQQREELLRQVDEYGDGAFLREE